MGRVNATEAPAETGAGEPYRITAAMGPERGQATVTEHGRRLEPAGLAGAKEYFRLSLEMRRATAAYHEATAALMKFLGDEDTANREACAAALEHRIAGLVANALALMWSAEPRP